MERCGRRMAAAGGCCFFPGRGTGEGADGDVVLRKRRPADFVLLSFHIIRSCFSFPGWSSSLPTHHEYIKFCLIDTAISPPGIRDAGIWEENHRQDNPCQGLFTFPLNLPFIATSSPSPQLQTSFADPQHVDGNLPRRSSGNALHRDWGLAEDGPGNRVTNVCFQLDGKRQWEGDLDGQV